MSILPITVYGDSILRKKVARITQIDDNLIAIIRNMFYTMRNAYGIGLAANQVNLNKQIFVVDVSEIESYSHIKPIVMINPKILLYSDERVVMNEGCLSLPNLRVDVERSKMIKVEYLDADENIQEIEADGLFARVILHEYDHLIGKMIPDRVCKPVRDKLKKELLSIKNREVDVDYPITEKKI